MPRLAGLRSGSLSAAVAFALFLAPAVQPSAYADSALTQYLDLPLLNRDASYGPGGINPALPYDEAELLDLLEEARSSGVAPTRYAALLLQYWLVDLCDKAGIDLATWDPRTGPDPNRENLAKSYTYYENLQLNHRELQWAGMGGAVGADFAGGLLDFQFMNNIFAAPGLAPAINQFEVALTNAAGPQAISLLPEGLAALMRAVRTLTPEDNQWILGMILVMQKNIFTDLMPMHDAYVTGGLPALAEFRAAGLFDDEIYRAWEDIASGDNDRISAGNAVLLRREQATAIGAQWDEVRNYKGDIGYAVTYLSTVAGTPSVAGVVPPRLFDQVRREVTLPDGRQAILTLPLPDWNFSVLDARWNYITSQLLPKYKDQVENHWPELEALFRTPYEKQIQDHRPLFNLPSFFLSLAQGLSVTVVDQPADPAPVEAALR